MTRRTKRRELDEGEFVFKSNTDNFAAIYKYSADEIKLRENSVQPASDSPAASGAANPTNELSNFGVLDYAEETTYLGAVDPGSPPWYAENDWSLYAHLVRGEPDKARTQGGNTVTVSDASLRTDMESGSGEVTWTKDNKYLLDGLVFVEDGETLTIEPGTVIKGKERGGAPGSSLVIARGGMLNAVGTAEEPIIFTHEGDALDGTSSSPQTRGKWGGLIILGRARLNTVPNKKSIEGMSTEEERGVYGGTDDSDNSGTLRYVSIRHGGTDIGAGNEINGLTLGGVGHGTTIEYIEVVGNKDDGIEFFGGTARVKRAVVAYCKDDSIDFDQGYRGFLQFVIVHQDAADGGADRGCEGDGGDEPKNGKPYGVPLILNLTSVGNPSSRAVTLRDNAGAYFYNSIFMGYGKGVDIEGCSRE